MHSDNYFAIAFTCVYLTRAVGVAKTTLYCMGRVNIKLLPSYQLKNSLLSLECEQFYQDFQAPQNSILFEFRIK